MADELISVLCFSRNRPLQLEAYLRSLHRTCSRPLPICVLYACELQFDSAYATLKKLFPEVNFVKEVDFGRDVLNYLHRVQTPLFMFGCDDVIFKRRWEPNFVLDTFNRMPALLGFSLRLGSEITYSHASNQLVPSPRFSATNPLLVWRWTSSQLEWGQPWELDCTIYRTKTVRNIITAINWFDWAHPNKLEGSVSYLVKPVKGMTWVGSHPRTALGTLVRMVSKGLGGSSRNGQEISCSLSSSVLNLLRKIGGLKSLDLMCSYPSARASVLTINRVQDIALNRTYGGGLDVDVLLDMWRRGTVLDINAYADHDFNIIHIGEAYFCERSGIFPRKNSEYRHESGHEP